MNHTCILITELIHQWMGKLIEPERVLVELSSIYNELSQIKKDSALYHPDDQAAQLDIVKYSMNLILHVIHEPMTPEKWAQLEPEYIRNIKKALDHNCKMSAEIQLTQLNEWMIRWEKTHRIEANNTRIVTVTTHGPRVRHIESSYFKVWFKNRLSENHLIENNMLYQMESLGKNLKDLNCQDDIIHDFLAANEINKKNRSAIFRKSIGHVY